ncbi:MAG: hypothetical protein CMO55_20455 [Verrucomicrobiales bacterium]|nr:hypothetical protein [Verrucomicrobiales bacterium]
MKRAGHWHDEIVSVERRLDLLRKNRRVYPAVGILLGVFLILSFVISVANRDSIAVPVAARRHGGATDWIVLGTNASGVLKAGLGVLGLFFTAWGIYFRRRLSTEILSCERILARAREVVKKAGD